MPARNVATIATPPVLGTGVACDERSFGTSITRSRRPASQVSAAESAASARPKPRCERNAWSVIKRTSTDPGQGTPISSRRNALERVGDAQHPGAVGQPVARPGAADDHLFLDAPAF